MQTPPQSARKPENAGVQFTDEEWQEFGCFLVCTIKQISHRRPQYKSWSESFISSLGTKIPTDETGKKVIANTAKHWSAGMSCEALLGKLRDDAARERAVHASTATTPVVASSSASNFVEDGSEQVFVGPATRKCLELARFYLVVQLAQGKYDSRDRIILRRLAAHLKLEWSLVAQLEDTLALQIVSCANQNDSNLARTQVDKTTSASKGRWWKVGLAVVGGGVAMALTAGLAAPAVIAVLGAVGASTAVTAALTSSAVIYGLFGSSGAGLAGYKMNTRTKALREFEFQSVPRSQAKFEEEQQAFDKTAQDQQPPELTPREDADQQPPNYVDGDTPDNLDEDFQLVSTREPDELRDEQTQHSISSRTTTDFSASSPEPSSDATATNTAETTTADTTTAETTTAETTTADTTTTTATQSDATTTKKIEVQSRGLACVIHVPGYLSNAADTFLDVDALVKQIGHGDHFRLQWESRYLAVLGNGFKKYIGKELLKTAGWQAAKETALRATVAALAWPSYVVSACNTLDAPWSMALVRSQRAGTLLAEVLCSHTQGARPVTLFGFSLGARLIFFCLLELYKRKRFDVVENAYLLGAPVTAKQSEWEKAVSVVCGRVVNAFSRNDFVLAWLYRTTDITLHVAGLEGVYAESTHFSNVDVTDMVDGHLSYRANLQVILEHIGGVTSVKNLV